MNSEINCLKRRVDTVDADPCRAIGERSEFDDVKASAGKIGSGLIDDGSIGNPVMEWAVRVIRCCCNAQRPRDDSVVCAAERHVRFEVIKAGGHGRKGVGVEPLAEERRKSWHAMLVLAPYYTHMAHNLLVSIGFILL